MNLPHIRLKHFLLFIKKDMYMYRVRYFYKSIFPRVTSQVTTSEMYNFQSGNFPNVRYGIKSHTNTF